jgi:hypothetical protein
MLLRNMRKYLGMDHPDADWAMANWAATFHELGDPSLELYMLIVLAVV